MAFDLKAISFAYPDRPVFENLSITIEQGSFYGIIGPNGCGKTTLLDIMGRLRNPDQGLIHYKESNLAKIPKKKLAREIALVPQNFYINFPFTALEVVMMGRYPHIPRFSAPSEEDLHTVKQAMEVTDTTRFCDRRITELSGGERQRVIFARALAQDTRVMLLDEATSNLDINHGLNLLSVAAGKVKTESATVIAVFQDINLAAAFCDRLILMGPGGIAAHGPTEEVLTSSNLDSLFHIDAKIYFEPFIKANQAVFRRKGNN